MKRLALAFALIAITLFGVVPSAQAQQGNCVLPGDILDVPTPGFLRNATPNLRTRVNGTLLPATLISHTTSRIRVRLPLSGLPYSVQFHIVHVEPNGSTKVVASARVCDDPNGGGSVTGPGGGGGSGRGAGLGQGLFLRTPNGQPLVRATRHEVAAPSGGPEYLLIGSSEEMARAQTMMSREGVSILRNTSLGALGARMSAVDLNGRLSLAELRSRLARQRISVIVDKHSVYGAAKGRTAYANQLLGLAPDTGCKLKRPVRVGLIDGPVDTSNPALRGVSVKSTSVLFPRDRTGSVDHATGIVALISGLGTDKLPQGISPGAEIFSVVAFARNGGRSVARLESIAQGLNWMVENNVDIVNMSLAGAKNDSLEDIVKTVARKGLIMVAATGNGGRDAVAYPASDPNVIAVTAIDASERLYKHANGGPEVDFSAPGVDLLLPRGRGTTFASGTSYAAAFATAIIAQEVARSGGQQTRLLNVLRERSRDLGRPGKDNRFGWGLIQADPCN
ncbi:S8 family serine peptidase [Aliiroseovarius sp. PrR006]|uniref:S8 family serine peptidase n=1 Tax=Aliiroseovarius sp. PrR006 TaxID=2706883 RepID=UPI0013D1709D|nr:S8 family serine peptidase [Aliiroseovarius sp. PrR006]